MRFLSIILLLAIATLVVSEQKYGLDKKRGIIIARPPPEFFTSSMSPRRKVLREEAHDPRSFVRKVFQRDARIGEHPIA